MMHERLDSIIKKEKTAESKLDHTIKVCIAASCLSSQSDAVLAALQEKVEAEPLPNCRVRKPRSGPKKPPAC